MEKPAPLTILTDDGRDTLIREVANFPLRMIHPDHPALVLAPMEGITDAPMRAFVGSWGAFTYGVSEFQRVSGTALSAKAFRREAPEVTTGGKTPTGMPVQVQILGGDPERMAQSAQAAVAAGAWGIDLNFGCPAPTVNRHDGGATLLKHPERLQEIVRAVVDAVDVPVSAKLRLGWDDPDAIDENAARAVAGGAAWITIHARTRDQGYRPPVFWERIGRVRAAVGVPVVANGDIWTLDDFRRCQDATGCRHFMLGRGTLANPALPGEVARELGLPSRPYETRWEPMLRGFVEWCDGREVRTLARLKGWLAMAGRHGAFDRFDALKRSTSVAQILEGVEGVGADGVVAARVL